MARVGLFDGINRQEADGVDDALVKVSKRGRHVQVVGVGDVVEGIIKLQYEKVEMDLTMKTFLYSHNKFRRNSGKPK